MTAEGSASGDAGRTGAPSGPSAAFVTALVDVGRGGLVGPFARSFEGDELPLLERLLATVQAPMVVYLDPRDEEVVWRVRGRGDTVVVPLRREDLAASPAYGRIQAIRVDPVWRAQAPWLPYAPLAARPDYAPMVLSRLGWLAEQARERPFGVDHVFWIDPGIGRAVGAEQLADPDLGDRLVLAARRRFLVATARRAAGAELHGFDWDALERAAGRPVGRVVRGGLYGGRVDAVAAVAERHDALLAATLEEGRLGTEESLLTILAHRDGELFAVRAGPADRLFEPLLDELPTRPRRRDTLVTAVYDLDPSKPLGGRSRSFGYYLPSLASIAQLGAGLVVYTRPQHVEQLEAHLEALGAPAVVVGRELATVPRHDQIQEIRVRQQFDLMPWRDRCHVLCHAKLAWLVEQVEADPFRSERFYWIDAGLAYPGLMPRRYLGDYFRDRCTLFTPRILDALAAAAAPLVLIGHHPIETRQIHQIPLEEHDAWIGAGGRAIDTHVIGGVFGGDGAALRALYADYDRVLAAMLAADRLGTEENVLTVLHHRDPGRARLLPFTTWYHEDSDVRKPGPADVPFYRVLEELAVR